MACFSVTNLASKSYQRSNQELKITTREACWTPRDSQRDGESRKGFQTQKSPRASNVSGQRGEELVEQRQNRRKERNRRMRPEIPKCARIHGGKGTTTGKQERQMNIFRKSDRFLVGAF